MFRTNYRPKTTQKASYTDSSAAVSNGFADDIHDIRVVCTTNAYVAIGDSPTATTSDMRLSAEVPEYFRVDPGEKIAAIRDSVSGDMFVTEMSTA